MAIVRSGRLANADDDDIVPAVDSMLQGVAKIGARKSWLSELCHELVIDIASATAAHDAFQASVFPNVEKMLNASGATSLSELRPEMLAVLVKVARAAKASGMSGAFLDCPLFKSGVVDVAALTADHIKAMGDPLRASCARFPAFTPYGRTYSMCLKPAIATTSFFFPCGPL